MTRRAAPPTLNLLGLLAALSIAAPSCTDDSQADDVPPDGEEGDDDAVPWPEDDDVTAGDDDSAAPDDDTATDDDTTPTGSRWPDPDPVLGVVNVVRWPEDLAHPDEASARAVFVSGGIDARFHDPAYQICGDRIDTDGYFASYAYPNLGWYGFWDGALWDPAGLQALDVGPAVWIGGDPPLAELLPVEPGTCHALDTAFFSAPLALSQWAWGQDYDLEIAGGQDVLAAVAAAAASLGPWFVPTSHATDEVHAVPISEPLALAWSPVDESGSSDVLITLIGPSDTLLGRVPDTGTTVIEAQHLAEIGAGDATLLVARERETRVKLPEGPVVVRARFEYWLYLALVP